MSIKILDDNLINKIAAGEVVERPGSVVKELVENAIDADASQITIEIQDGGISLIRISDNGRGIPASDVYAAFMRHATSKIATFEDLETVLTLGFRGEALSSIASVAQVEMITKQSSALMAKRIEIHGGKLILEEDVGAVDGTTIIVRNLFYNTPARRKFLKKPSAESAYITEIIQRMALGNPEVSFRYIVNNSEILYTNGNGSLKTVILNIFGKEVAKNLVEVEFSRHGFGITGYICKPQIARGNRNYGSFFINGRYIKSTIIQSAIEEAYKTRLPIGKFPVFVLKLSIDPKLVDVNVHPTKLEVRFSNENEIYDFCCESIHKALSAEVLIQKHETADKEENTMKELSEQRYKSDEKQYNLIETQDLHTGSDKNGYKTNISEFANIADCLYAPKKSNKENIYAAVNEEAGVYRVETPAVIPLEDVMPKRNTFFTNYRIIGQFFYTYWLIEQENSIYMIDQHAAHERVLYEEILNKLKNEDINSQRLLQPIVIDPTEKEKLIIEENLASFIKFGFEIEKLDDTKYVLKSVPFILKGPVNADFFIDLVDKLENTDTKHVENIYDTKLHTVATMACKAAVKGNDKLSYAEARELIEKMIQIENPFTCPHGRPTIIELTKYEVEKMFKRIQ